MGTIRRGNAEKGVFEGKMRPSSYFLHKHET
jgi:hypothetical protein